jgi:hypothetical protein
MSTTTFKFWHSDDRGLIRQRSEPGSLWHPEVWDGTRWVTGSAYVMDAITGMGEDPWSCGEMAQPWDVVKAETYAKEHGIDLYSITD